MKDKFTNKSYVSIEKEICSVCGTSYNTGNLLIDKRMTESLKKETITGFGMCPEHDKMRENGYIALVEIDPAKSQYYIDDEGHEKLKLEDAYRTGRYVHVTIAVAEKLFNIPVTKHPICFIQPDVFSRLIALQKKAEEKTASVMKPTEY